MSGYLPILSNDGYIALAQHNIIEKPLFFDLATQLGKNSDHHAKMGAVIHRRKQLISSGWNQIKSHPHQARYRNREARIYLHAEIHAIINAKQDLEGCSITIGRLFQNGKDLGSSRICSGCRLAVEKSGIQSINYWHENRFVCEYV